MEKRIISFKFVKDIGRNKATFDENLKKIDEIMEKYKNNPNVVVNIEVMV